MNGYVLISRSLVESEIWKKPPLYLKVWIWLLCNAQFKSYKGLERGELFTSIEEIRQACAYYSGYRKEIPSKKQIYSIIDWLRNPHGRDNGGNADGTTGGTMVVTTGGTHGMVVNICNFNKYQDPENYGRNDGRNTDGTTDGTRTGQRAEQIGNDINETDRIQEKKEKQKNNNNIYISPALGKFGNVLITEEELGRLKERFPYDWEDRVERLSEYMKSKGKRYKSHYATILTWARKDADKKPEGRLDWIDEL